MSERQLKPDVGAGIGLMILAALVLAAGWLIFKACPIPARPESKPVVISPPAAPPSLSFGDAPSETFDKRQVGKSFILAPGERTGWFEMPEGAAYLEWFVDDTLTTDRRKRSGELVEGIPSTVGNGAFNAHAIRFRNTTGKDVGGRVMAWFPRGRASSGSSGTDQTREPEVVERQVRQESPPKKLEVDLKARCGDRRSVVQPRESSEYPDGMVGVTILLPPLGCQTEWFVPPDGYRPWAFEADAAVGFQLSYSDQERAEQTTLAAQRYVYAAWEERQTGVRFRNNFAKPLLVKVMYYAK